MTIPPRIRADQVKGFALAAGKVVLDGGVGRMARATLRNIPRAMGAGSSRRDQASAAHQLPPERAAWIRFLAAYIALDERRADFALSPDDLTAEQVRWAEVELEDAIAVAGEFQVHDLPWSLA